MMDNNFSFNYHTLSFSELDSSLRNLVNAAKDATTTSYAPYSHFSVGAAVLLENGNIVKGSNQENVAYPSGLCAERVAIFAASANYPDIAPVALAIAARKNSDFDINNGISSDFNLDFTDDIITPCGACRQVLVEVEKRFGKPLKIIMYGNKRIVLIDSISQLLPLSFDF